MRLMTDKRRLELIRKLFDERYECQVAPLFLEAVANVPVGKDGESIPQESWDGKVIHTVVNTNSETLMETMFGETHYTGEVERDKRTANTPVDKRITITQMADIIKISGRYSFNDPRDATGIVDTVNEYINGLYRNTTYEPFYHMPPEEDLDALKELSNRLTPLTGRLEEAGVGMGDWAEIDALFGNTGLYMVGGDNDDFLTAPLPSDPLATSRRPTVSKDPYKF